VHSGFLLLLLSGVVMPGADGPKTPPAPAGPERIEVPPPPFSDGIFPSLRMFTAGLRSGQCRCVIMWREKVSLEVNRICR
jgi:hypothetical protein